MLSTLIFDGRRRGWMEGLSAVPWAEAHGSTLNRASMALWATKIHAPLDRGSTRMEDR
jgi:hypothetical protein